MGRGRLRSWWSLGAVTVVAIAVALVLYLMWRSPRRDDLATYGAFALPVAVVVAGWFAWAWRRSKASRAEIGTGSENLDGAADQLAAAVEAQWEKAAGERRLTGADPIRVSWSRPSLPMATPLAAAMGSRRFDPLPGLALAGEMQLRAGQIKALHAVYGGLRSGRLIITGPPGSGKSGVAVLLVLAALRHRKHVSSRDRPKVPVPVLVTAQDWDPDRETVIDWLTRKLQGTYQVFAGSTGAETAAALISSGRIAVILDGLDEITPYPRSTALQALSQQASFRLVVLSRSAEMAAAASAQGVLQGAAAIELNPVGPAEAASYLERVQLEPLSDGWRDVIDRIRTEPASPLSIALNNPLTLTLVRDTYQSGDQARALLGFCDITLRNIPNDLAAEAITDHLLDRVLPAAYTRRPGQPPLLYDLATAQYVLTKIAAQMNQEGTRDLQWWRIPTWAPPVQRLIVSGLTAGLACGLAAGSALGLMGILVIGLGAGLMMALMLGFGGRNAKIHKYWPKNMGDIQFRNALTWGTLAFGLASGVACGLELGLIFGLRFGLTIGPAFGLTIGIAAAAKNMQKPNSYSSGALDPTTSRSSNRKYYLVIGLGGTLMTWFMFVPMVFLFEPLSELALGLTCGVTFGLALLVTIGLVGSEAWATSLASAQLAIKWHTPIRLMRFLNDAYSRDLLRTVGPTYQFRHARLQDRLAATANPNVDNAPSQTSPADETAAAYMELQESAAPAAYDNAVSDRHKSSNPPA